jgi:hypothetical protein
MATGGSTGLGFIFFNDLQKNLQQVPNKPTASASGAFT